MNKIISLGGNRPFEAEITGEENADTAVIMVHGFGVKRDSRGLFTDLEGRIKENALSIRGDFSDTTDDTTNAVPLSIQAQRLTQIIDFVSTEYSPKQLKFIGHSQGCIVVALAKLRDSRIILLAPPIENVANKFADTPGWSRPGSSLNTKSESILKRSDGSITRVRAEYWKDFGTINAGELYEALNKINQLDMIFAAADQVLGTEDAPPNIRSRSIANADHDFRGEARDELITLLMKELQD